MDRDAVRINVLITHFFYSSDSESYSLFMTYSDINGASSV